MSLVFGIIALILVVMAVFEDSAYLLLTSVVFAAMSVWFARPN
jgi:hypothetical protein